MSTGAGCYFKEVEPGRWVYGLQRWPFGDTEEYDKSGPFNSFAAARGHLDRNHANPGGWSIETHPTGHVHEFTRCGGQVVVGFDVAVRVDSLGPLADRAAVVALVQSLPASHPAIKVQPHYGWDDSVVACEACGEVKR